MDLVPFYNNLLIASAFPFKTDKHPIDPPTTKRHRFIDGLALLLNGSKSATAVYPWLEKQRILITCNGSLISNDKKYFDEFFLLIREYSQECLASKDAEALNKYVKLKSLIFKYNKEKCIKRIVDPLFADAYSNFQKLLHKDSTKISEDEKYKQIARGDLSKGTCDYLHLKKKKKPLDNYISMLFEWVKHICSLRDLINNDPKNSDPKLIEDLQSYCASLYHSVIFRAILSDIYPSSVDYDRIQYYLNQISAHHRSFRLILKCLEQQKSLYGEMYKNIRWQFIKPVEDSFSLTKKLSSIFDQMWSDCGLPNDQTKIDFEKEHMNTTFDKYDQELCLKTCMHCEIRMIDYLLEQNIKEVPDRFEIEIGISKLSCYPCALYIQKLNEKFNRQFCITDLTTHGKIYPKWQFRNNEDDDIKKYLIDELKKLIEKELIEYGRNLRTKSGDSDKQGTDIEDDDVNEKFVQIDEDYRT